MHYFDFLIRLKTEQEHLFRNIQRNEYHNLFQFVQSVPLAHYLLTFGLYFIRKLVITLFLIFCFREKGLKIMNFNAGGVQNAEGVAAVLQSDIDDAVDPHLERIRNEANGDESDEEVRFLFPFSCISEFVRNMQIFAKCNY